MKEFEKCLIKKLREQQTVNGQWRFHATVTYEQ